MAERARSLYRPRRARAEPLWRVLDAHFDEFIEVYSDRYEARYGALRRVIPKRVQSYLRCGILDYGFARVRCPGCRYEYLVAFSCKGRGFCPSCQAKRQAEFSLFLQEEVLAEVPHRQVVFSVPRRLRPFFLRDRKLLAKLARCGYETVRDFLVAAVGDSHAVGEPVNVAEGAGEALLKYMVRAPVVQERITPAPSRAGTGVGGPRRGSLQKRLPGTGGSVVIYKADRLHPRHGANFRVLDVLDFIALVTAHIPDPHEKSVIYYGWYSNRSRGERRKHEATPVPATTAAAPAMIEDGSADAARAPAAVRRAWAAMIRRVYEVDPLVCPRCSGEMEIVSFIEDEDVIFAILKHLGLLAGVPDAAERAPPETVGPLALDSIQYDEGLDFCESFPA